MRTFLCYSFTLILFASGICSAETVTDGIPSDETIKGFVKEFKGEKSSLVFDAAFAPAKLPARSLQAYAAKGKAPFRVTMSLFEKKTLSADDVRYFGVFEGKGNIAILGPDGKLLDRKEMDLDLLCPS